MSIKKQIIELLEHSIEQAEAKIEELSKPSQKSSVQIRSAERDFWKKKAKYYESKIKDLEDENRRID
jgi:hypothetical protein